MKKEEASPLKHPRGFKAIAQMPRAKMGQFIGNRAPMTVALRGQIDLIELGC